MLNYEGPANLLLQRKCVKRYPPALAVQDRRMQKLVGRDFVRRACGLRASSWKVICCVEGKGVILRRIPVFITLAWHTLCCRSSVHDSLIAV